MFYLIKQLKVVTGLNDMNPRNAERRQTGTKPNIPVVLLGSSLPKQLKKTREDTVLEQKKSIRA